MKCELEKCYLLEKSLRSRTDQLGNTLSISGTKELNATLGEEYDDFTEEEIRDVYGNVGKDKTVNLVATQSSQAQTAISNLDDAKIAVVKNTRQEAVEAQREVKKENGAYSVQVAEAAIEEVVVDTQLTETLVQAGFAAEEVAELTVDGVIELCEETSLPPNQTDTQTETMTPPDLGELARDMAKQYGPRVGFELFGPGSGITYPFMECKYENGCFSQSDYSAQKEFMMQQEEDLSDMKNAVDPFRFDAPLDVMNNLKQYLKITFAGSPVDSVMSLLGAPTCFSRTATACRLLQPASAGDALAACFGGGLDAVAERVSMDALVAGDTVLADGAALTRVVVNQHAGVKAAAPMLTLHFEGGSLSLTADHVLLLDGALSPARLAAAGSVLSSGRKVSAVTHGSQGVVNPITAAGTILAT